MTYTLLHENLPIKSAADVVVVTYDDEHDQFSASICGTTDSYTVDRGDFVADTFKYPNEVIEKLISGFSEADDVFVLISDVATNAINSICDGNRNLF